MATRNYTHHQFYNNLVLPEREMWWDVIGFEGFYKVSTEGRIKSLDRIVPMRDGRKYTVYEKILKPAWDRHYFHVILSKGGKEFVRLVHRLVLEAFVGPCPEGMECCHNDGNSRNNRLENLRWDLSENNHRDKKRHGTSSQGRSLGKGNSWKLRDRARKIIRLHQEGATVSSLAVQFEVTPSTIYYHLNKHTEKKIRIL